MSYVYIISNYDEHGSESVHATLDINKVPELITFVELSGGHPKDDVVEPWRSKVIDAQKASLELALKTFEILINSNTPEELSKERQGMNGDIGVMPHNLQNSWGGLQLHVVKLK